MKLKNEFKAGILVLLAVMLLFFVVNGILSFAETAEGELAEIEQELTAIDGGIWVNISTESNPCQVSFIRYFNYNCDNNSGYSTVCVSNYCSLMPEEAVKIKSRILEIKRELEVR